MRAFPDVEAIVAQTLRDAGIAALGTRVYSSIPKRPTYPLVVVQRTGGLPAVRRYLDSGTVQVEVWGTSKSEAHDIAQQARVELLDLEGTAVTDPVAAFITAVDDAVGLTWDPDTLTARDRYFFAVAIFARST